MKDDESELSLIESILTSPNVFNDDQAASGTATDKLAHKLKDFFEEIPGGFFIYRAGGDEEIIYANKALLKIYACENRAEFRELTGNSFRGMVHPGDLEAVEESIIKQIKTRSDNLDYVEYRIVDRDGNVHWVEDYGHFIHTETHGDIFYVFISDATEKIARTISEKAEIISNNRKHEQRLQSIIEEYDKERKLIRQEHLQRLEVIEGLSVNYDSILYVDLDTDKVLPYRLSSRFKQQFGDDAREYPFKQLIRDYIDLWVHPDDRERVAEMTTPAFIRRKLVDDNTYYTNYRCIQNGETLYLQLRMVRVGKEKHVSQIVMGYRNVDDEILQEIKKKKLLEETLRSAKLASVAKDAFLSNMSHDMRTPLNAIFGYAALVKKHISDNAEAAEYIGKIETAAGEILNLIDEVLELSYMESQDFRITESECDMRELAEEVCHSLGKQAEKKRIALSINSSVIHKRAYADADKLRQILAQIIGNGVKYTPPGGKVAVSVSERQTASDEFSTYIFEVTDTGIGIDAEFMARIFEPFERENNSTISGVFGPGLGLPIAKHLAEIMGGDVSVKSEPSKGSTFTVSIGLRTIRDQESQEKTAHRAECNFAGKKILIVEDNEINLEIETEILQDLGFGTDSAENGKIAVEKIAASRPGEYDLVLMDIQMPVMDGREAAKAIRALPDPALASIPIVALSANAFESDKRISMEAGMDEHLTKPIDVPVLTHTIERILALMGNSSDDGND